MPELEGQGALKQSRALAGQTLEGPLGARLSEAARKKVRARALSELGAADAASDFLRRLPRDQLYVMRVMGIARSISTALGGTAPGRLRAYGDAAIASEKLVEVALQRKTEDNVSAIVLPLGAVAPPPARRRTRLALKRRSVDGEAGTPQPGTPGTPG